MRRGGLGGPEIRRVYRGIGEKMPQHDYLSRHMTGDTHGGVRVLGDLRRYRRVPAWRFVSLSDGCEVFQSASHVCTCSLRCLLNV
jgi:hypothetical protein